MHQYFTDCHVFATLAAMPLILFNKPYQVICQFSRDSNHPDRATLADYLDLPEIYPAGRLDTDSEGLMLLTDDGKLQHAISHPDRKQFKTYLVQVDGTPQPDMLERLRQPLDLGDFTTQGGEVKHVHAPTWLWERNPPIRQRKNQATSWLTIRIAEGGRLANPASGQNCNWRFFPGAIPATARRMENRRPSRPASAKLTYS